VCVCACTHATLFSVDGVCLDWPKELLDTLKETIGKVGGVWGDEGEGQREEGRRSL
jgi:hypothetical protein